MAAPLVKVRVVLVGLIVGLVLSGVTAFPLRWEVGMLCRWFGGTTALGPWLARVREGVEATGDRYPFLAYGTDWLAFAHLVIAAAFIGPWVDPVRNKFILQWGVFCCVGVFPLAMIAGPLRGIPPGWRLIDCSFGVLGLIPLLLSLRWVRQLERAAGRRYILRGWARRTPRWMHTSRNPRRSPGRS